MTAQAWLRAEAVVVLSVSILAFHHLGHSWWLFAGLALLPDLSMLGYLAGRVAGAVAYNLAHTYALSLATAGAAWLAASEGGMIVGVVWTAHIALDRALGYGLKSAEGFTHTHLGRIGQGRRARGGDD